MGIGNNDDSQIKIEDCRFLNNNYTPLNSAFASILIEGSEFTGNKRPIQISYFNSGGNLQITNTTFNVYPTINFSCTSGPTKLVIFVFEF